MEKSIRGGQVKDFQILSKLGEGSFSIVYKVKRLSDSQEYAMKKVKLNMLKEKEKQNALDELRIMASITDENIIGYKEAIIDDQASCLFIIMEYADKGDLQKLINENIKNKRQFEEGQIWRTLVHISKGLKVLHGLKILHRDLKCANIFLSKDDTYKIGDLNVSKVCQNGLGQTQTGTPYYASPEVWRDEQYDAKSDIWSLGIVLYEMCALKPPFRANDMEGLYKKVQKGMFDKIPGKYSNELWMVISSLLKVNPRDRPTAENILNNPIVIKNSNGECGPYKTYTEKKSELLSTIKLPKNLQLLKGILPKANYDKIEKISEEDLDVHPKSVKAKRNPPMSACGMRKNEVMNLNPQTPNPTFNSRKLFSPAVNQQLNSKTPQIKAGSKGTAAKNSNNSASNNQHSNQNLNARLLCENDDYEIIQQSNRKMLQQQTNCASTPAISHKNNNNMVQNQRAKETRNQEQNNCLENNSSNNGNSSKVNNNGSQVSHGQIGSANKYSGNNSGHNIYEQQQLLEQQQQQQQNNLQNNQKPDNMIERPLPVQPTNNDEEKVYSEDNQQYAKNNMALNQYQSQQRQPGSPKISLISQGDIPQGKSRQMKGSNQQIEKEKGKQQQLHQKQQSEKQLCLRPKPQSAQMHRQYSNNGMKLQIQKENQENNQNSKLYDRYKGVQSPKSPQQLYSNKPGHNRPISAQNDTVQSKRNAQQQQLALQQQQYQQYYKNQQHLPQLSQQQQQLYSKQQGVILPKIQDPQNLYAQQYKQQQQQQEQYQHIYQYNSDQQRQMDLQLEQENLNSKLVSRQKNLLGNFNNDNNMFENHLKHDNGNNLQGPYQNRANLLKNQPQQNRIVNNIFSNRVQSAKLLNTKERMQNIYPYYMDQVGNGNYYNQYDYQHQQESHNQRRNDSNAQQNYNNYGSKYQNPLPNQYLHQQQYQQQQLNQNYNNYLIQQQIYNTKKNPTNIANNYNANHNNEIKYDNQHEYKQNILSSNQGNNNYKSSNNQANILNSKPQKYNVQPDWWYKD